MAVFPTQLFSKFGDKEEWVYYRLATFKRFLLVLPHPNLRGQEESK